MPNKRCKVVACEAKKQRGVNEKERQLDTPAQAPELQCGLCFMRRIALARGGNGIGSWEGEA
jgi:hypothetical protein